MTRRALVFRPIHERTIRLEPDSGRDSIGAAAGRARKRRRELVVGCRFAERQASKKSGVKAERVAGTVATNVLAYERGARIFRVHDVVANVDALMVAAATVGSRGAR